MNYIEYDNLDATFHFEIENKVINDKSINLPVLMIWRADNCVMIGKNQVIEAEVNLAFANDNGINIVCRPSGGGAIYCDLGTLLYTMIVPFTKDAKSHMEETATKIIRALNTMGVDAYREGRNDILLDGKKISGMAQYTIGKRICTHGSLLFDTNMDTLTEVLIPHDEKLIPKGIRSIRSRVTNIKPYINEDISVAEFKDRLRKILTSAYGEHHA